MPRRVLMALLLAAAACVEVPDTVRAQFAPPGPGERTNYRPGTHGSAPPVEDILAAPPAPVPMPAPEGGPATPDGGTV